MYSLGGPRRGTTSRLFGRPFLFRDKNATLRFGSRSLSRPLSLNDSRMWDGGHGQDGNGAASWCFSLGHRCLPRRTAASAGSHPDVAFGMVSEELSRV